MSSPAALVLRLCCVALSSALAGPLPAAWAQTGVATLEKIAATGTIGLGHRESSVPFSYLDNRQRPVGYSHELMLKVAEAVKTELKLPALTLKLVPVTSQNRFAMVQNGSVDLECGSSSNTPERARQVSFSTNIFVVTTRLLTHRHSAIRDWPDLRGKRLVVTTGTTSERLAHRYNEQHQAGILIRSHRDHAESFAQLEAGAADAFFLDDALLYGARARAQQPDDWVVVGQALSREAYACMLRHGDAAFKRVVDAALTRLMLSGEAQKIYLRWFQSPIPRPGLNLNWPASAEMQALFRQPSDAPMQ